MRADSSADRDVLAIRLHEANRAIIQYMDLDLALMNGAMMEAAQRHEVR